MTTKESRRRKKQCKHKPLNLIHYDGVSVWAICKKCEQIIHQYDWEREWEILDNPWLLGAVRSIRKYVKDIPRLREELREIGIEIVDEEVSDNQTLH